MGHVGERGLRLIDEGGAGPVWGLVWFRRLGVAGRRG